MSKKNVTHRYHDLVAEAKREREVVDSLEAEGLKDAVFAAVLAYSAFLERNGLIWEFGLVPDDPNWPRLKAHALVATVDYGLDEAKIELRDGAIDRVYGNGVNPDPYGLGPPDITRKRRIDE
jgi:hypothetical protein